MQLMYAAQRYRPDLLLATIFLTQRTHEPRLADKQKILRVIAYLRKYPQKNAFVSLNKVT